MAISSYPFQDQDTTEGQYSALFREFQDTGVVGSFGDASLRTAGDSTGMNVKVSAGPAIVRGFFLSSTTTETLPIAPAAAQARVDRVVARLDPAADSITFAVRQGTPAVSPEPPSLTQTDTGIWEMPLSRVTVRAGTATIAAADVVDERPWIGHRVGVWTSDTQPVAPRRGRLGLNTSSGRWEYWTGTAWTDLAPIVTWASITGRPATFAPSAHTHAQADITGLVAALASINTALAGRALTSHTHTKAQISGLDADLSYLATQKADLVHGHSAGQISYAGTNMNTWANSVDTAFNGVRADIAYLSNNKVTVGDEVAAATRSSGPTGFAYNRESGANRYAVWMDSGLQFGRAVSSRRYKEDIADWDVDVDAILSVVPKTFHRKVDEAGVMDFGAIAEEVHDAGLTELVYYDDDGQVDGIRDHRLPWVLLAVVRAQQTQIDELVARLDARDA